MLTFRQFQEERELNSPERSARILSRLARLQNHKAAAAQLNHGKDRISLPNYSIGNEIRKVARSFTNPNVLKHALTNRLPQVREIPYKDLVPTQAAVFTHEPTTIRKLKANKEKLITGLKYPGDKIGVVDGHHATIERAARYAGTGKNRKDFTLPVAVYEKLELKQGVKSWIHDFVHSDNKIFNNKPRKDRIRMAMGAFYSTKRKESARKARQTRKLRKVFGVPPGRRRHAGPRVRKLEERYEWLTGLTR